MRNPGALRSTRRWPRLAALVMMSLLWIAALANAGPAEQRLLRLEAPATVKQAGIYRPRMASSGVAHLHLAATLPQAALHADLTLSSFKAEGQPTAIVGLSTGDPQQPPSSSIRNLLIRPTGLDVELLGSELTPGVPYEGQLSATVADRQTLVWDVMLVRPAVAPLFSCPRGPQPINSLGTTGVEFSSAASAGGAPITAKLSPFSSKDQQLGEVRFAVAAHGDGSMMQLPAGFSGTQRFTLPLRVANFSPAVVYSGAVRFFKAEEEIGQCTLDLELFRRSQGELQSDRQYLTQAVVLPAWPAALRRGRGRAAASFTLALFDATRSHTIGGLTVRLDGPSEAPEGTFDLQRHVRFLLNGILLSDFTRWVPAAADPKDEAPAADDEAVRTLVPGEQASLELDMHDLDAGKYTFALRFSGVEAAGPSPKIDFTVTVKHHWIWAVFAIICALVLSFLITKGIANWRARAQLRSRIEGLRAENFGEYESLPSVVFLHVVLDQATALLERTTILAPPASVDDYLQRAERVAAILRRYTRLYERVENLQVTEAVSHFYFEAMDEVMLRIGPRALDQPTADGVTRDLDAIDARLSEPTGWYWTDLKSRADALAKQARAVQGQLGDQNVVGLLLDTLEAPPLNPSPAFDYAYWMVKLLESRRTFPEDIAALIAAYDPGHDLWKAFQVGDLLAWQRLQAAVGANGVRIGVVEGPESLQSLRPLKFRLCFADPRIGECYFVRNILQYEWQFTFNERMRKNGPASPRVNYSVRIDAPRATHYVPVAGDLEVKLLIRWPAAGGVPTLDDVKPLPVPIADNAELSLLRSINASDVFLMLLVAVIAVATSLPALYINKPTFGSVTDYIAILAWAIGIDQGKNLIQLLKQFP